MKRIILFIMMFCFVLSAAGCTQKEPQDAVKETPAESGPPTITASAGVESSEEPSVSPSEEAVTSSPEPSAEVSQSSSPAPSPSEKPSEEPPTAEPKDYLELGFGLMETDGIDSIKIDMSETDLTVQLGEPDSKTTPMVWGADGMEHSDWIYESEGLELGMWKEPESSAEAGVFSIRAVSACTLATQRGIKIGDTKDTVEKAYEYELNEEDSSMMDSGVVAGSVYGGMIFHFEDGKVSSIFIGATAE